MSKTNASTVLGYTNNMPHVVCDSTTSYAYINFTNLKAGNYSFSANHTGSDANKTYRWVVAFVFWSGGLIKSLNTLYSSGLSVGISSADGSDNVYVKLNGAENESQFNVGISALSADR